MTIKLTEVNPNAYEGEVKEEFSALQYPVEVQVEWYECELTYQVESPKQYKGSLAWFLTNNPELNNWSINYWKRNAEI